jgi:hypothetical protein
MNSTSALSVDASAKIKQICGYHQGWCINAFIEGQQRNLLQECPDLSSNQPAKSPSESPPKRFFLRQRQRFFVVGQFETVAKGHDFQPALSEVEGCRKCRSMNQGL